MSEQSSNTSRWGKDDQKGAMNLVTPERTLAALQSAEQGRMIDLSQEIQVGHPRLDPFIGPMTMGMWSNADTSRRMAKEHFDAKNDPGVFTERVELCMHTGTHIDALGHITIGDEMYNGWSYRESTNNWGLERLGIEHMPPLITRAVLLDVSTRPDGSLLTGGDVVTVDDLKRALDKAKTELQPGDVALINTGWGRLFMADNETYTESEPGIDEDAARWLTEQQVCAIGADNMAVEVLPYPDPRILFPVHQHTLVEAGVHLIENLAFDAILQENVSTFCFILLPVKVSGATACPVRPVAVL